ncbi:GNAT family N-acetyltransferase [Halotalea alkalilenta]|uniref:Acetyltransferase n=1 Tax=Halotalea alkalilenta TaxID=376489 RepID=A0A172YJX1_9GAMM|nr:GNAT family N-acetyltransferase [Halotalea alkalilenta]ANF59523.1 acetyltransferase [Halotalea alkalilenta]
MIERIRDLEERDLTALTAIYNDAVAHTTAIWNERLVDIDERRGWHSQRLAQGFPVLAAVDAQDRLLGYATYGAWRPHDGYRLTVEHSVYVDAAHRGAGIGRTLMLTLIERAEAQGMHVMVAGIDAANHGSIALHQRLGFVETGTLREVGTKFGRWLDLTLMQKVL